MTHPTMRLLVAASLGPTPCECLCATWAHQDCTGEGTTLVTIVRSRYGRTIRVCGPCGADLAQRVPASARSAA